MLKSSQLVIRLTALQKSTLKALALADGRGMAGYVIHKLKLGAK